MDVRQAENANEAARKHGRQEEERDLLDAWREQVEQARSEREVVRVLAWDSADTYADFLDSIFFYYGENARAAETGTSRKKKRTRS